MKKYNDILKNKKIDSSKLLKYGFIKNKNNYFYDVLILNNKFKLELTVNDKLELTSRLIDKKSNEEYILIDLDTHGEFVGKLRDEIDKIINDFIEKCTNDNIFKSKQSKVIIKYIKEKYNIDFEYLWKKFPNNAIARKSDGKWFIAILTVKKSFFGFDSNEEVEVIDLRYKNNIIIDNKKVFPGYHMNKKSWYTIILDNGISDKEIIKCIDNSYCLK